MRRAGPILAAAAVLLANAAALIGVAGNRSGEPDAVLELTERELALPYVRKEDTGLVLRLRWEVSGSDSVWERPDWLDQAKLEEIGYDCSLPLDDPVAETWYRKARTRQVYAVLEHEGEAWKRWLEQRERELQTLAAQVERREKAPDELIEATTRVERRRLTISRLFVVDVGRDARTLRDRYPDRLGYIVTPALVDLAYWKDPESEGGSPHLGGYVRSLMIEQVHVPRDARGVLDQILAGDEEESRGQAESGWLDSWSSSEEREPRYALTVSYGRRHEPWVEGVRLLESAGEAPSP